MSSRLRWWTRARPEQAIPPARLRRVELDPSVLAAGGLHETPAGWRARLRTLDLDGPALRVLRGRELPDALRDVVDARRDRVWRRLGPRWFLGGALISVVAGAAVGGVGGEPLLGLLVAAQYGLMTGFIGLLIGRWRYDRHRKRVLSRSDPALAATDQPLGAPWVDALKALAVAPAVARTPELLLDGTAPARASLAAWAGELHRLGARCATWQAELAAGEEMVAALGALGGERGRAAGEELDAQRRRVAALVAEVRTLEGEVARAAQDLRALVAAVEALPAPAARSHDLRELYLRLGRVQAEAAAVAALLPQPTAGAG